MLQNGGTESVPVILVDILVRDGAFESRCIRDSMAADYQASAAYYSINMIVGAIIVIIGVIVVVKSDE